MDDGIASIIGHIVGARIFYSGPEGREVLYTFPAQIKVPLEPLTIGAETLKSADIQGLHIGMTFSQFEVAESKKHSVKQGSIAIGEIAYFNNSLRSLNDFCGTINLTAANSFSRGDPAYSDCVAAEASSISGPSTIGTISSEQTLRGVTSGGLIASLEAKYGKPLYFGDGGSDFTWLGKDPDKIAPDMVKVEASFKPLSSAYPGEEDLFVTLSEFQDKKPAVPASTAQQSPNL